MKKCAKSFISKNF